MSVGMADSGELGAIFKAYDVRGVVPTELDARRAFAIGAGFARFAAEADDARRIAVAHDMRTSGTELARVVHRRRRVRGRRGRPRRAGFDGSALLRLRGARKCPGRCSPPRTTRRSTTGSSSAWRARSPSGRRPGSARSARYAEERLGALGAGVRAPLATADGRDWPGEFARHVRSFIDCRAFCR